VKVLQVANGFPPASVVGVEQYTHTLARALSQHHEVYVFCAERTPDRREYALINEEMDDLAVRRVVNNFRDVAGFEDLYVNPKIERLFEEYVDQVRPDLIHFQHCIGLSATLPHLAARWGIPFVITLHDYWYICPTVKLLTNELTRCPGPHQGADCRQCFGPAFDIWTRLHRIPFYDTLWARLVPRLLHRQVLRLLKSSRRFTKPQTTGAPETSRFTRRMQAMQAVLGAAPWLLAPSRFVRDVYKAYGVPEDRISVLPLGLDTARWANQPESADTPQVRFGYFGSLQAAKGIDFLVRAFVRLEGEQVELLVYGAGKPDEPFAERVRQTQDARIRFLGRYDNSRLPELMARVDVVVIPSIWHETFSIVAREALLARLPVIASAVGALPEVIVDNANGLLVPPSDEDALHQAMARLVDDRYLLTRLKPSAAAVIDIHDHVNELEHIYKDLKRTRTYVVPR